MWLNLVAAVFVYSVNGTWHKVYYTLDLPVETYGFACHEGIRELRADIYRIGGQPIYFECTERVARGHNE